MSRREKAVSTAIVIFFLFCFFQQYGQREDWPFSFFGMYQTPTPGFMITRFDLDYMPPGGQPVSLYRKANGYYFMDKFRMIAAGQKIDFNNIIIEHEGDLRIDDEVMGKIRQVLVADALPILERDGVLREGGRIRLRYRRWNDFEPERRLRPDQEVMIWDSPVSDLLEGR